MASSVVAARPVSPSRSRVSPARSAARSASSPSRAGAAGVGLVGGLGQPPRPEVRLGQPQADRRVLGRGRVARAQVLERPGRPVPVPALDADRAERVERGRGRRRVLGGGAREGGLGGVRAPLAERRLAQEVRRLGLACGRGGSGSGGAGEDGEERVLGPVVVARRVVVAAEREPGLGGERAGGVRRLEPGEQVRRALRVRHRERRLGLEEQGLGRLWAFGVPLAEDPERPRGRAVERPVEQAARLVERRGGLGWVGRAQAPPRLGMEGRDGEHGEGERGEGERGGAPPGTGEAHGPEARAQRPERHGGTASGSAQSTRPTGRPAPLGGRGGKGGAGAGLRR